MARPSTLHAEMSLSKVTISKSGRNRGQETRRSISAQCGAWSNVRGTRENFVDIMREVLEELKTESIPPALLAQQ